MTERYHLCEKPRAIMSALADEDCRTVLVATAEEPQTVSELVETCDIPMATAYRKVDRLTELELLDERIRVSPEGRNSREYRLQAESIHVAISEDQTPAILVDCAIAAREPGSDQRVTVSTDGGQTMDRSPSSDQQHRLRQIFEDITGAVGFVETQEQPVSSRFSDDEHDATVSEYVTAVAKADGLSDAITTPEMNSDLD